MVRDWRDLNGDGKIDAVEWMYTAEMMGGNDKEEHKALFGNTRKSNYKLGNVGVGDDLDKELEMAGLDRFELEMMDEDERREVLEDAGLDPDDYDF
jgi:hypothetical protein